MIYISGAITGTDDYMERFAAAERELTEAGHKVVNPAKVNAQMPSMEYAEYMRMAITMLDLCDAIYMLDGWENSKCARLEHAYAEAMGMDIIYPTPKQEEKKYYWRLNGNFQGQDNLVYLNVDSKNGELMILGKTEPRSTKTRLTESQYKSIAQEFHFPEDMFVREEIE